MCIYIYIYIYIYICIYICGGLSDGGRALTPGRRHPRLQACGVGYI